MTIFSEPIIATQVTERVNPFNFNFEIVRSDGSGASGWLKRVAPVAESLVYVMQVYRSKDLHHVRLPGHVYRYFDVLEWGNNEIDCDQLALRDVDNDLRAARAREDLARSATEQVV